MDVLVVALLLVAAPDRRADRLDDDDLAALELPVAQPPLASSVGFFKQPSLVDLSIHPLTGESASTGACRFPSLPMIEVGGHPPGPLSVVIVIEEHQREVLERAPPRQLWPGGQAPAASHHQRIADLLDARAARSGSPARLRSSRASSAAGPRPGRSPASGKLGSGAELEVRSHLVEPSLVIAGVPEHHQTLGPFDPVGRARKRLYAPDARVRRRRRAFLGARDRHPTWRAALHMSGRRSREAARSPPASPPARAWPREVLLLARSDASAWRAEEQAQKLAAKVDGGGRADGSR